MEHKIQYPREWENPNWDEKNRIHNWKNYISDDLRQYWQNFSDKEKKMIAANAEGIASNEEWD